MLRDGMPKQLFVVKTYHLKTYTYPSDRFGGINCLRYFECNPVIQLDYIGFIKQCLELRAKCRKFCQGFPAHRKTKENEIRITLGIPLNRKFQNQFY